MIKFDDLLQVPYLDNGRTMEGLDCYGLVLICFERFGTRLKDITKTEGKNLDDYLREIGIKEVKEPSEGCGVQFYDGKDLHVGFMLDKRSVLHITSKGVRITPLIAFRSQRFFKVEQ